ncbi:MAG: hypothetical protein VYE22_29775 [Myxococcota bacterium]|nr:hypothetical protein [Myxococcota bacterium]
MTTWPFWALFLAVAVVALMTAKRLDDRERERWRRQASEKTTGT